MRACLRIVCICGLLAAGGAGAAVYPLPPPDEDLLGAPSWTLAAPGDSLASIAYAHGLGFREVLHANPGLDPWQLRPGQRVELPTGLLLPRVPRTGIVINRPEMRLYYFPPEGGRLFVYPVAVGRTDWSTPLGTTRVRDKVRDPFWFPPESIRAEHAAQGDPLPDVVEPGPDNPLGALALRLGWPLVLIHGTDKPMGIGMPVTHGCVRLYPGDVEKLFDRVAIGTQVTVIDQPYKLGRHEGRWYLEAHPLLTDDPKQRELLQPGPTLVEVRARVGDAAIDWDKAAAVLRRSDGMPVALELAPAVTASVPRARSATAPAARYLQAGPAPLLLALLALGLLVGLSLVGLGRRWRGFHRRNLGA